MRAGLAIFVLFLGTCTRAAAGPNADFATDTAPESNDLKQELAVLADECQLSAQCPHKDQVCVDGKCVTNCKAGTKVCHGKDLAVCNASGSAWVASKCDDGDACTLDDCDAKALACSATAAVCDDGNPCTADACDAILGCQHGKEAVADGDKDGFTSKGCGGDDCDDTKKLVNPVMKEDCATIGVDDNCDGKTDEGCDVFTCEKDGDACGGKGKCSGGHCFWTNSVGYKFTLVPGGNFWMGWNGAVEQFTFYDEEPQHPVDVSPFWIGVYEVKVSIYQSCKEAKVVGCTPTLADGTVELDYEQPVQSLKWASARAVCQWFGGDLPTEAQWEKAARGGCALYLGKDCAKAMPKYPWGNSEPICGKQAWCKWPLAKVGLGSPLGQSPYGAFDMAGNVEEWTLDFYDDKFYGKALATAKDPVNMAFDSANIHSSRGGGVGESIDYARSSGRNGRSAGTEFALNGVRCALPFK